MAASEFVASPATTPMADLQLKPPAPRRDNAAALLAVIALTAVGSVLRAIVAHQSIFADELSTYWISATHGLGGVLSLLYSSGRIAHAEITPPLSFLASWLSTRLGKTTELLRLPELLAGTATIPLVYALGLRSVGRRAAVLAAAVTALSPFMIYYSAEARAYGLMMFLLVSAVLSMLLALDTGRLRYWALYAVFAAAAFYTHYTCAFVLAVALVWLLWAEPGARRKGLLAGVASALLVVPWIPGLVADLQSPTIRILSALSPFTANAVRIDLQHWALGYPYTIAGGLVDLPGRPALALLAGAVALSAAGLAGRARRSGRRATFDASIVDRRILLVAALTAATPVGEVLGSAVGTHIIGVRDLAASWPFLALFAASLVIRAGPRLGTAAAVLTVVAFALAAPKLLETRFQRPDYQGAADYVAAHSHHGDVVVDETGRLNPGPLTSFDIVFHRPLRILRALAPAERDHPFTVFDPIVLLPDAFGRAVRAAHGARVFVVSSRLPGVASSGDLSPTELPDRYRRQSERRYPGLETLIVSAYAQSPAARR